MTASPVRTAGPWIRFGVRQKLNGVDCIWVGPDGLPLFATAIGKTPKEGAEAIRDADFVVRAVNSHDELVELVRAAYNEGFGEGMNEDRKFYGGKPWRESSTYVALSKAVQS